MPWLALAGLAALALAPTPDRADQVAPVPPLSPPGGVTAAVEVPASQPDPMPVPPGAPADQALWREAGEVSNRIYLARMAANGLLWDLRQKRPDERLAAAAKIATPEEAARLEALRARLIAVWTRNYEILVGQWPVDPTRGCNYARVYLGSSMQANDGPRISQAREDTRACVDVANAVLGRLEKSMSELRDVSAEVDRQLQASSGSGAPPAKE
jgi:hypothetical protein